MEDLVEALRGLQANVTQMYAQAHGYHWNVEGMIFKELHAFFLKIYKDVFDSIDEVAENTRKFDGYAIFGADQIARYATVKINDSLALTPKEMLSELLKTNYEIIDNYNKVFNLATVKYNEQGLANFIADRIDHHKFWQWQLKASLKSAVM
jgi:starvation-inducible DNA-binding protein